MYGCPVAVESTPGIDRFEQQLIGIAIAGVLAIMNWLRGDNHLALKIEFFYGRDWDGVGIEEFIAMLDAYLRWYRDIRIKSDLDYRSPMQYRRDLGLVA